MQHSLKMKSLTIAFVGALLLTSTWTVASVRPITPTAELGAALALADQANSVYLKVNLRGNAPEEGVKRTPVNIALVIDKSGSMQGEKIEKAREAAVMAVNRLSPEDIVSIIVYDTEVSVIVPATRATDKEAIYEAIGRVHAAGNTALFAGVSKGAAELRKFRSEDRANRIVLLSDGLANVGPSSPAELAELGTSLATERMSVSTIGLGLDYNEDLMARLAESGGGNHIFAENAVDLARAYDLEFGDLLSVVAQEVRIRIDCPERIRIVRVMGHKGVIDGRRATIAIPQVYANQDRYIVAELEVPAFEAGNHVKVADVEVTCPNADPAIMESRQIVLDISGSAEAVEASINPRVMASVSRQLGTERMLQAQRLRDAGDIAGSQRLFVENSSQLLTDAERYRSEQLRKDAQTNRFLGENSSTEQEWKRGRKVGIDEATKAQLQGLGYLGNN
ncbi:MAG: VWA domain-containing protein [Candidatus Hydrogenedentes bacterium]|nr:VWA domain-containing protein [Candidatus Hydrogenedentota bacterium]